jgi:hypothetical protein
MRFAPPDVYSGPASTFRRGKSYYAAAICPKLTIGPPKVR